MHSQRAVPQLSLLLSLLFTLSVSLTLSSSLYAQQPSQQQCSLTPPVVTTSLDGTVTIDLGTCFIFPSAGPYQAFDFTQGLTVLIPSTPQPVTSVSLSYSSLTLDMRSTWDVAICTTAGCQDGAAPPLAFGSQSPEQELSVPPLRPSLVIISEHAWIADYQSCWNAGYYCWFTAKFTLR